MMLTAAELAIMLAPDEYLFDTAELRIAQDLVHRGLLSWERGEIPEQPCDVEDPIVLHLIARPTEYGQLVIAEARQ